jgi:uncharacterized membrane protein
MAMTSSAEPRPAYFARLLRRFGPLRPVHWLLLAMVVYFAVALYFSLLRSVELQTSTWDLGIYQQALWSTAHGRPFYEAADYETGGFGSFLQVHSAYVLYLVVPVYSAWPYEGTLFVIQTAFVAAAAYPLFLLGRDVTKSPRLGLVTGLMYLAWAPTLASNLYDFHIEAFLPIEIFAFVLLWSRGRYGWGLLVALVAFATMELTPVLLFFVGLYFLLPDGRTSLDALRKLRTPGTLRRWLTASPRRFWSNPRLVASVGLMVSCVVAYYLNLALRERFLAPLLGIPAFPSHSSGYVIGGTLGALGLLSQNIAAGFVTKVLAWVLLLVLLGFVPLLAPRTLVLAIPWVGFTFLSANLNYVTLGFQYGFIEAAALLVAFTFGLGELARRYRSRNAPRIEPAGPVQLESVPAGAVNPPSARGPVPPGWTRAAVVLFGVLLAINVAATPLNLTLHNSNALGAGYRLTTTAPPGFDSATDLSRLVPPDASVLASDDLFPLVANDLNAYSFFYEANPQLILPFSPTHLPEFVFVSESRTDAVPSWISDVLYNRSDYGVRGIAWSTAAGAVVLFETGYRGSLVEYATPSPVRQQFTGGALDPQAGGRLVGTNDPNFPEAVESVPGPSSLIWSAPNVNLPAGDYAVTLGLEAHPTNASAPPAPGMPVLFVNSSAFAQPVWFQGSFDYAQLNNSTWSTVSFSISVTQPALEVEIRGYLLTPTATIELAYLDIAPAG